MARADVCRNVISLLGQRFADIFEDNTDSEHEEVRRRSEMMVFLSHIDNCVMCEYQIARAVEVIFLRSLVRLLPSSADFIQNRGGLIVHVLGAFLIPALPSCAYATRNNARPHSRDIRAKNYITITLCEAN